MLNNPNHLNPSVIIYSSMLWFNPTFSCIFCQLHTVFLFYCLPIVFSTLNNSSIHPSIQVDNLSTSPTQGTHSQFTLILTPRVNFRVSIRPNHTCFWTVVENLRAEKAQADTGRTCRALSLTQASSPGSSCCEATWTDPSSAVLSWQYMLEENRKAT